MNNFLRTLLMFFEAAKYSIAFCWRNYKVGTLARVGVAVVTTTVGYLGVQLTGMVINSVQALRENQSDRGHLVMMISFFVATLFVGAVGVIFNWVYRSRWNERLRYANRQEINDHRSTLDVATVRSKQYDDLQKRINELPYSWGVRITFAEELLTLFSLVISFLLFGMSLVWYRPAYALVLVIASLPMVFTEFRDVAMWWNHFEKMTPAHKERAVLERPFHARVSFIQALMFNQLPFLRKQIAENVEEIIDSTEKARLLSAKREILSRVIATTGLVAVVIHMIWSTAMSSAEIGTLAIVLAASRTFQSNLEGIVFLMAEQWNSAKGILLIEKDFFGLMPRVTTQHPILPAFERTPLVRFDRVSFCYPDTETEVLHNVSFTIEPGTKVAIVGKSGNGKTTIQSLLMRHYDPTRGAIYADEINLRNIEPSVWCKYASSLTQDFAVLERKVGEEIASARLGESVSLSLVERACEFADFSDVVRSDPKGFDSRIGVEYGGRDFSGGERQRLALARVHYRGTPILILDEPDSKLDPESAERIINNIFALENVTVVMITHHVSRAERCDKILVMGKGEITEQGTHQELLSLRGTYASMFEQDRKRLGTES